MKPHPPNEDHVELVIKGDDPESHRTALETARILAAPQIARTIQKQIDECKKRIDEIIPSIIDCRSFLEGTKNAVKMDESSSDSLCRIVKLISSQCIQTEHQIEYARLMATIPNTYSKARDRYYLRSTKYFEFHKERRSEWEHKSRFDYRVKHEDFARETEEMANAKKLEMEANDDEADRVDVQTLIKCHIDVEKILTDSYLSLSEELKQYKGQLEDLVTLVKGK